MLLVFLAALILIPIVHMILVSFGKNVVSLDGGVLPTQLTLQNYRSLFTKYQFKNWMGNSIIIASGTMVLTTLLTMTGSYVLSRFHFVGNKTFYKTLLLIQVFPLTLSMVAVHRVIGSLGLLNSPLSLILVDSVMALPYSIMLAKGYFDTIPRDVEESAYMDGAGKTETFIAIIIPLVKPAIATVAINSFVLAYNEYVLATVLLTEGFKSMPLAVGLRSLFAGQYGINWPVFAAASFLGSLPMILIFVVFQDYFISGLTEGATKG